MEGPGSSGFRFVGEREVHRGHLWSVTVATFESPDGVEFVRDVVRSPGAVAVVPVLFDAEGLASVVLVEQYRPPFDELVVEAPAGMRDVPGEPPEATAHRELAEEVGLRAGSMELLTVVYPSPGMTDATTTIFLATECEAVPREAHGPEEQHMRVLHVPLADALAMVDDGRIRNAATIVGLLATERRLRS
ncbi:MAG: NUDIX hydrolase [Ilumatobacteraceae bacterium]|jgi:ADP-ribose pyrophosphatase|nr:NUDIX hydrolase [Ilumatobacteraceae bacterium]